MFKVLIVGGKSAHSYEYFEKKCIQCLRNKTKEGIIIYSTGDKYNEIFSKRFNIDVKLFKADFNTYKNNALKVRNSKIFSDCDALIVFDDGLNDTKVLLSIAENKKLPYRLIKK